MSLPSFSDIEKKRDKVKKEGFDRWVSNPQTKLLVSMVGASEPKEVLMTLLRTAYEDGIDVGCGVIIAELALAMITKEQR